MEKQKDNDLHHSSSGGELEQRKLLGERLRMIRTTVMNESRAATAKRLGVSLTTLQNYENGERDPGVFFLVAFAKAAGGIRLEWLATGEGMPHGCDMPQTASESQAQMPCTCLDTLGNPVDLSEFVFIPRYNLKAAAGHGAAVASESPMFSMSFRRYWIENYLRVDPKDLSVLSVKGDSMEGVLNNKDVILVNHADTSPVSGLYVLRVDGDLLVKRVQKLVGGRLAVLSANEAYRPQEIDPAKPDGDFAVIGRVVWFGRQI